MLTVKERKTNRSLSLLVPIYLEDQEGMKNQEDNKLFIIHQNCRLDSLFTSALPHWFLRRNSRYSAVQGRMSLAHISYISAVNLPFTTNPRGEQSSVCTSWNPILCPGTLWHLSQCPIQFYQPAGNLMGSLRAVVQTCHATGRD